ncbi:MAG: CoA-binding protein, partial [Acidimicrobiia bacterium]|nr:CoA-binding protein [Acidimicrobiia bacterium]
MQPKAGLSSRDGELRSLSEFESGKILESYGIPVVATTLATTGQEAVEAAASTGYPVVLKGCSADLTHKSEAGAVKLNLTTSAE